MFGATERGCMQKRHFIALADFIRAHNADSAENRFQYDQLLTLARFCERMNPGFKRQRWLGYIAGTCGPSGGLVRQPRHREEPYEGRSTVRCTMPLEAEQ